MTVPVAATAADALDAAQRQAVATKQLPGGLTVAEAYEIQHAVLARRTGRGERVVGTKLGFTSEAKMAQMGVSEIIVGQLTDAMQVPDGAEVDLTRFIHPRIEPEVAFRLSRALELDDPDADIATCVDAVAPALEIIDSRYRDFRFSLPDVVADNTSAAAFVIGPWLDLLSGTAALPELAVELVVAGVTVERGSTSDILGHPVRALRALVPMARKYGFALPAGQIVLAGAATAAVPFAAAVVEARVATLGSVSVRGVL
ncbi:MAG: 2-keto-4-pentenoate hydratase [Jatrophihabitantaceae bacterium]